MKKLLALALALALGGCYTPQDRAVGGAAIGGVTGATIGAIASNGRAGDARRRRARGCDGRRCGGRHCAAATSAAATLRPLGTRLLWRACLPGVLLREALPRRNCRGLPGFGPWVDREARGLDQKPGSRSSALRPPLGLSVKHSAPP